MMAAPMGGNKGRDVRAAQTAGGWVADVAVRLTAADRETFHRFVDPDDRILFAQVERHLTWYRRLRAASDLRPAAVRQALRAVHKATRALQATVAETAPILADLWDDSFPWPDVLGGRVPALEVAALRDTLDQLEHHVGVRLARHEAADWSGRPRNPPAVLLAEALALAYREALQRDGVTEVSAQAVEDFVDHAVAFIGLRLTKHVREHLRSRKPPPLTG